MSNGSSGREEWKLVCSPGEATKKRLGLAIAAEAKARGCMLQSVTYQLLIPTLLHEAMDARGIPRVDDAPEPAEDDIEQARR